MKRKLIWLTLYLGSTSAGDLKNGARVRGITTQYRNTSQPVEATTMTGSFTLISDGSDTGTSTTGFSPLPRIDTIGSDSNTGTNPGDNMPDASTSSSRGSVAKLSGGISPPFTGCIPSVATYTGAIPDTVYVTTDTSYEVTVTASNVSMAAPTIYETPQSACSTIVVPTDASLSAFGPLSLSPDSITTPTMTQWGTPSGPFTISQFMFRVTSTVTVTKKTPVQVIQSFTVPPVSFKSPIIRTDPASQTRLHTTESKGGGINVGSSDNTPGTSPGNAIISVANPTTRFVVAPATPTIPGVTIVVGPSSIAIGGQIVTLPAATPITVTVSSQTFTVNPSEIIGPSTTFQLQNQLATIPTITQAPSVISTAGVVLTIGATTAVVLGTTYRIGPGAVPTTLTVNGQTIAIGTDGVVFSGASPTTYAPAMTVAGGYEIVTVGSVTVAVDQSEAVISGTTFRIGDGAPMTTVTFGSQTITIGPSGVVLASMTIHPTTVPTIEPSVGSASTSIGTAKPTSSGSTGQLNLGVAIQQSDTLRLLSWLAPFLLTLLTLI